MDWRGVSILPPPLRSARVIDASVKWGAFMPRGPRVANRGGGGCRDLCLAAAGATSRLTVAGRKLHQLNGNATWRLSHSIPSSRIVHHFLQPFLLGRWHVTHLSSIINCQSAISNHTSYIVQNQSSITFGLRDCDGWDLEMSKGGRGKAGERRRHWRGRGGK
jgi:hypothetical protein